MDSNPTESTSTPAEPSFGAKAVGLTFNPSGQTSVNVIKQSCADLIDFLNASRDNSTDPVVKRMLSLAITDLQTAQMWGVKAVTWPGTPASAPAEAK